MTIAARLERARALLVVAMIATLPLHTVFFDAWIAWKPFLVFLVVIVAMDVISGLRDRQWPWNVRLSVGLAVLLGAVAVSWSGPDTAERFASLWLAIGVGGAVLLVTERSLRAFAMSGTLLRTVFWSGAAMGVSAVVLSLVAHGVFGASAIDWVNDIPGVFRTGKPAYLESGFIALTNWHQDPGYAAAWMNLWAVLALCAAVTGHGSTRRWVNAVVIGLLGFGTVMTMSRTGWIGLCLSLGFGAVWLVRSRYTTRIQVVALLTMATTVGLVVLGSVWLVDPAGVGGDVGDELAFRLGQGASLDRAGGLRAVGDGATTAGSTIEPAVGDYRTEVWPWYVDAFKQDPLRGAGLGTGWDTPGIQEPHNLGLQLLGETGLVGVAGFLVLAFAVVRTGAGAIGVIALFAALLPALTQTVLFEPTLWFAGGLYAGRASGDKAQVVA